MGSDSWAKVTNCGILSKGYTDGDDLIWGLASCFIKHKQDPTYFLSELCDMLSHKLITCWVIKHGEAPGITESNQVRLSGVVVDIKDVEL